MKKKLISLILASTICLAACSKVPDKTKVSDDTDETVKESVLDTDVSEETEGSVPIETVDWNFDGNTVYLDMSGMNADQIFDNLMSIRNFDDGITFENFIAKFDTGNGTFERDMTTEDAMDYTIPGGTSYITRIGECYLYDWEPDINITLETPLVRNERSYVYTTFEVADLETAQAVYDKVMDWFATFGTTSESLQVGQLHGSVKVDGYDYVYFSVTLQTDDDGPYRMSIDLPVCDYPIN